VDSVLDTVITISGTDCFWSQVPCYFWIHWSTKFTETLNSILLTNFHNDARSSCHLLGNLREFWEDTSVNFEEFFSSGSIQSKHLHGRNFKTFFKNHINYFTSKTCCNSVRLNNSTSVIGEVSGRFTFWREK